MRGYVIKRAASVILCHLGMRALICGAGIAGQTRPVQLTRAIFHGIYMR
jgi:hypothetical protein